MHAARRKVAWGHARNAGGPLDAPALAGYMGRARLRVAAARPAHVGLLDLHVPLNLRALFAQPVAEHVPLGADAHGVPW